MALGFGKKAKGNDVEKTLSNDQDEQFEQQFEEQGENDVQDVDLIEIPKNLSAYIQPEAISLKEIGASIDGIFLGLKFNEKGGFNGEGIWTANFKMNGIIVSCILSYQIREFLINTNFPQGKYLRITRTGEVKTKSGQKLGIFKFEYDPSVLISSTGFLPIANFLQLQEKNEIPF